MAQHSPHSGLKLCRLPAYGVHDGARLLVCSRDLVHLFGAHSASELAGREIFHLLAPEARDNTIAAIMSGVDGSYRSIGLRLDGKAFPMQISCTSVRHRGDIAHLFTVRDLSPLAVVVDDEATIARMTGSLMRNIGYQTAVYTGSTELLADYQADMVSVLVSDVQMPGMDGVSMVEKIREFDAEVPVIFVSGYSPQPIRGGPGNSLRAEALHKTAY